MIKHTRRPLEWLIAVFFSMRVANLQTLLKAMAFCYFEDPTILGVDPAKIRSENGLVRVEEADQMLEVHAVVL